MTGEEAARALEALAVVFRIRTSVSASEVVGALSTAMGVVRVDGPMTNAEKCRQYRHRKRHHDGVATVSFGVGLVSESVAPSESPDLTYQVDSAPDSPKTPSSSLPDRFVERDTDTVSPTVSRKRRWRRVPTDWSPKDSHRSIAAERGVDFELELSKYRDHDFAQPKSDPDATFRNWLRSASPARKAQQAANRNESAAKAAVERARRIEEEERLHLAAGGRQ